mmetsp:Transcript_2798/g.9869  ORF Transcript_2798/g.9869 Transcript_2798/m.9869 type:complete len:851 (-) Transcript_2798:44-2596(-)
MGTHFRSQEMSLVHIYLQIEAAHDILDELGQLGLVQFRDLQPEVSSFQRNFVNEVKRADEMQRKLRYFYSQCELQRELEGHRPPRPSLVDVAAVPVIDELERQFEDMEAELKTLEDSQSQLDRNYNELVEMSAVLNRAELIFEAEHPSQYRRAVGDEDEVEMEDMPQRRGRSTTREMELHLMADTAHQPDLTSVEAISARGVNAQVGYIVGAVSQESTAVFEKVLWRVTRGNLFFRCSEIENSIKDPATNKWSNKNAFVIFYQGDQSASKIRKICEAFNCNVYPCPDTPHLRKDLAVEVAKRIDEVGRVLEATQQHRRQVTDIVEANGEAWAELLVKEKGIYHTMNLFEYDNGRKCLIAEGWCPADSLEAITAALRAGKDRAGSAVPAILSVVETKEVPPTFHRTNDFTDSFQEIVDMYGVARYQEVNPGPFTIITFPFLFGVMFGDVGHGLLLFLFALVLVIAWLLTKGPVKGSLKSLYSAKWLLLLMGIFSIYCGFMYNECFALPMGIFPTNWEYSVPYYRNQFSTQVDVGYVYPFGVDPLWKGAKNELDYYNSLKMKTSVTIGVAQMTFGIILSAFNAKFFKKKVDLYTQFIPQMLFLQSIFGYMVFLILLKWLIQWDTNQAPRLLNLMIDMILQPWAFPDSYRMFPGQHLLQLFLVGLAVVCIPWMLVVKPLYLWWQHKQQLRKGTVAFEDGPMEMVEMGNLGEKAEHDDDDDGGLEEEFEEFELVEEFIHQSIHTIEFILGCISNTASYLRLWALSLAHAELAAVFYERVLLAVGLESENFFLIFCSWAVWAVLTFCVLLAMESMSAFLHALRLHWVEFQNKFYMADGYKFIPFSYNLLLEELEE